MKSILTKIYVLSLLCALPALANDVGLQDAQPTQTETLVAANSTTAKTITSAMLKEIEKKLKDICFSFPAEKPDSFSDDPRQFSVVGELYNELYKLGIHITGELKTRILQQPVHGTLKIIGYTDENLNRIKTPIFGYTPYDKNYLGKDRAVFEVEATGQKFRVSYELRIVDINTALLGGGCPEDGPVDEGASNTEFAPDTARVGWASFHLAQPTN